MDQHTKAAILEPLRQELLLIAAMISEGKLSLDRYERHSTDTPEPTR
jgi:hypothetical protein